MIVTKKTNIKENAYDNISGFWVVSRWSEWWYKWRRTPLKWWINNYRCIPNWGRRIKGRWKTTSDEESN